MNEELANIIHSSGTMTKKDSILKVGLKIIKKMCGIPYVVQGGTLACGRGGGVGGPNSDAGTYTVVVL